MSLTEKDDDGSLINGRSEWSLSRDGNLSMNNSKDTSCYFGAKTCGGSSPGDMQAMLPLIGVENGMKNEKKDAFLPLDVVNPQKRENGIVFKKSKEELERLAKQVSILKRKLEAEANSRKLIEKKLSMAESTVATQKKEILLLQRQLQSDPGDVSARKLETALREIASLKLKLSELEVGEKPSKENVVSQLQTSVNKLSAEKDELLNCVRRQGKLIDILKRQKLHLEAAVLIDVSEKELGKYFDLARP